MATEITTFKKYVATDVLPCPDPIVEREILNVIIEFCEKTHIMQREFAVTFDTDSDGLTELDDEYQNAIDVDISEHLSKERMVSVMAFNLDGIDKYPEYRNITNTISDSIWESLHSDNVLYFSMPDSNTIRVYDRETSDTELYVALAVKPTRSATSVQDFLLEDWLEPIVAGVKAKILAMPGKEWTNGRASLMYKLEYRRGISRARAMALKGFSKKPVEIHGQNFGEIDWNA